MILNHSRVIMLVPKFSPPNLASKSRRTTLKPLNYSNSNSNINQRIDTDSLRTQLDQLYSEANTTRSKANNARMRLMRLSEAAENLQKRAAIDVQVGKEAEARDLLVQKKKLMNALEKSRQRIDVLDRLATNINEAITLKEAQLIGNVSMYPEFTQEDSDQPIRFVNPKIDCHDDPNRTDALDTDCIETVQSGEKEENYEESLLVDCDSLKGISYFEEFLQSVDGKLKQVESELVVFLKLSTMVLESDEKKTNTKVQQTSAILENIRSTRMRIASIIKATTNGQDS